MECIPIYQTFILFSWTSLGMIIFNEYRFYNLFEIVGIFASACVCLYGVKLLAQKHQKTAEDEAQELELACTTRTKCGSQLKDPEELIGFPKFPADCKSSVCRLLTKDIWSEYYNKKDAVGVSFKTCIFSGC